MPFYNQPIPVLVAATEAQKQNKNTGIGGRILDFVLGTGTGANVPDVEMIIEPEKKDNTVYYVLAGVIVLLGGLYLYSRKK